MLTKQQSKLLRFIAESTSDGVSPSYWEMMEFMGLKSTSGVHGVVAALELRGFIRRIPGHARSIEVIRLPCDTTLRLLKIATTAQLCRELETRIHNG